MIKKTLVTLIYSILFVANVQAKSHDPYESFNRSMYDFNDGIDTYVGSPIANGYKFITPPVMQTGVFNFFNNLKGINVVLNDVLQAKFSQSAEDLGRFTLNSTAGLGGFIDVAKHVGLEQNEEDFDQTLAAWGVPQGSYLVLPFIGPNTMRGTPAFAVDAAANPASYASAIAYYVSAPVQFAAAVNARANAEGALKFINEAALDKYVFTRESFLQWRKSLENDGKVSTSMDDDLMTEEKSVSGLNLRLSDYKQFEIAAKSFGSVAQKFDCATKNFEQAGQKIDQLKQRK